MASRTVWAPPGKLDVYFLSTPDGPVVDYIHPDSPVKERLSIGEIITRINDTETPGKTSEEIAALLLGTPGQQTKLTVVKSSEAEGAEHTKKRRGGLSKPHHSHQKKSKQEDHGNVNGVAVDSEDGETYWEVERIVSYKIQTRKAPLFQVKWKGSDKLTWEPEENLCDTALAEAKALMSQDQVGFTANDDDVETNIGGDQQQNTPRRPSEKREEEQRKATAKAKNDTDKPVPELSGIPSEPEKGSGFMGSGLLSPGVKDDESTGNDRCCIC